MITAQIKGGLGNQMFQYAMARALGLRTGRSTALDITSMKRDAYRKFELPHFNIEARVLTSKWQRPPKFKSGLQQTIANHILSCLGQQKRVSEAGHGFSPEIARLNKRLYLTGFWQSELYFLDQQDAIRRELTLKEPFAPARQAVANDMASGNAVSLHVRRGDYVASPDIADMLGTFSPEWYHAAMARIETRMPEARYFVFSDDPQWVRDNIRSNRPVTFVDPQDDGRHFEDMVLMSHCDAHILSNSTFSWWGAWLDSRPDKHVIAPSRWFRSEAICGDDIVPASWDRL